MKRYGVVAGILFLSISFAHGERPRYAILDEGYAVWYDPEPAFGTPDWVEWFRRNHLAPLDHPRQIGPLPVTPAASVPNVEIVTVPWSEASGIKEGISELKITPSHPSAADNIAVTVSGWKMSTRYAVRDAELQVLGNQIGLDIHWHETSKLAAPASTTVAQVQGFGGGSRDGLSQLQSAPVHVITKFDVEPFDGTPYTHRHTLGRLSAGMYTLTVTNDGPVAGSASTTFIVKPAAPASQAFGPGTIQPPVELPSVVPPFGWPGGDGMFHGYVD